MRRRKMPIEMVGELRFFVSKDGQLFEKSIEKKQGYTIRVDRVTKIIYPEGVRIVHEEFEHCGPTEYSTADVAPWLHEKQLLGYGMVKILDIYKSLISSGSIRECLSLHDFFAISQMPVQVFDSLIEDNVQLLLPKSTIENQGRFFIPAMYKSEPMGGVAAIRWVELGSLCSKKSPTPLI